MKSFSFRQIKIWRRLFQLVVLLAFILIPILNKLEINVFFGSLLAFNAAGIPFNDPLAALQVALNARSATSAMLGGAGLVLLLALFMGPVFCSWICPFGFLSELVHKKKTGSTDGLPPVSIRPYLWKVAFFLGGGLVAVTLGEPFLNNFSMPGWYTRIMQHAVLYKEVLFTPLAFILIVLAVEKFLQKRFWCRYLCPQSVLLLLAGLLFPRRFQVRYQQHCCICPAAKRACVNACSLGLNPRELSLAQKAQCTNCGDCVDACAKRGKALSVGFGRKG